MNSYELQQLYIKKRENKTTTKQGETETQTTTPNQHKQRLHIVKRPKRKICGNFGLWDLKLIIRINISKVDACLQASASQTLFPPWRTL